MNSTTDLSIPHALQRRQVVLAGLAMAAGLPLAGCGGGAAVLFAPFFEFGFEGVIDRRLVTMSFSPQTRDQTSGNFDANSIINVSGPPNFVSSTFSGSFNGRDMQLTLATPEAPLVVSYNGRFTFDDTILLTPRLGGASAFTVCRNDLGAFVPSLAGSWVGNDGAGNALRWSFAVDPSTPNDQTTVLLTGTETRGTAAAVAIIGHASVRHLELVISRVGGPVRVTGRLQESATPPPAGNPRTTATIQIDGGGSLTRA